MSEDKVKGKGKVFTSEYQPKGRGKSKKTMILEMLKENAMLDLSDKSTNEDAEKAFFHHVAKSAFNHEDANRGVCLNLLANKGWSNLKPSNELIEFDFDINAEPHIQASQVMDAASSGLIPPDIANTFIQSIKAMIDIEEFTQLKVRIEKLEKALNGEP